MTGEKRNIDKPSKTILLLADCWSGAKSAGRFAAQMLYDQRTRIILLNTYQRPSSGMNMLRSVAPILEKTARKDLDELKGELVREYGIPEKSIEQRSVEGELVSVIQTYFSGIENLSVVLGQSLNNPFRKGFCRKVINALLSTNFRPVFMVSNIITLIESSRTVLIAGKEENISSLYRNYLSDIFSGAHHPLELVTRDVKNGFELDIETLQQYSAQIGNRDQHMNTPERLLYELINKTGPG